MSKLHFGKRFVASLWCTVVPVQWIESARERARNWDKAKKEEAWKEKEEKTGGKGKKRRSLNECVEKRAGIETDTPHHTTVETLTSPLSLFPPCHHSFSPSLFPSLHLLCHCTWPLHVLSLHFLSFTPFLSFAHHFSFFSVCTILPSSSSLPSFFLRLNSPLSSLCLPQSVSSLRIWQRFHLFWHPRLLPLSLSADFFLFTASRSSLNLFFFSTHILRFSPLQMLKCPFYRLSLSLTIRGGLTASPSWPSMSGPRLGRESQDHRVTLQKKKKILEGSDTAAIWQSTEGTAPHTQAGETQHCLPTDTQCEGMDCVPCGRWACPPLISFPWRIDIIHKAE